MEISKPDDKSRELVPFREPADMSQQVSKATERLNELKGIVDTVCKDQLVEVKIEKNTIDDIIDSLKQLDSERIWLHEAVEEETIRSSVYRHKLGGFLRDIEGEIRDAVRLARDSNAATIAALKSQLKTSEENKVAFGKRFELLSKSNVVLGPEQNEMRVLHGESIDELNKTLLQKARMQIRLNETRDELRDTIVKTNDFRQACLEIKEDMVAERKETIDEENRLQNEIKKTLGKIEEQRRKNLTKKEEVNESKSQCLASENNLQMKKDVILHHETNKHRLMDLCRLRSEQFDKELDENMKLQNEGDELNKDIAELNELYGNDKRTFQMKIGSLTSEIQIAQVEFDQLQSQKIRAMNLLDAALLSGRKDKDEAEEMQKSLRVTKDDLLHQTSECTRLKRENIELENLIDKTLQDHIGTSDVLKKQIQTFKSALLAERKERQLLQNKRDEVNKEMSEYLTEFNKFTSLTTRSINERKIKHQSLNEQGTELQQNFIEAENTIKSKQKDLQSAKSAFINFQKTLKDKVMVLKNSITDYEKELKSRTEKYDNETPVFQKLKETHQRKSDEFEQMKKLIVEVKMNKAKLEANVESKQTKLEDMDAPKNKVESELIIARETYLQQLKRESNAMKQVENDIFESTTKYNSVRNQNERFAKAIDFFESDIKFMQDRMQSMQDGTHKIDITVGEYKEIPRPRYFVAGRYQESRRREVTAAREKKIEYIHGQLEEQLNILSDFLDNAAQLRVNTQLESK